MILDKILFLSHGGGGNQIYVPGNAPSGSPMAGIIIIGLLIAVGAILWFALSRKKSI